MAEYYKGQTASYTKTVTDEDVRAFAKVTGDENPVHLNDAFAARSQFGARIAHGFLTGAMISKILGMDFPGPGTVYLSQSMKFMAPAYIGDTLWASVTVTDYNEDKNRLTLLTEIHNQKAELILTGEAVVMPPR